MYTRPLRLAFAALLVPALVACGRDAGQDTYRWSGSVAPGAWVRIHDVNGSVRIARAAGPTVLITATRTARGRRPEPMRMLAEEQSDGVVACAVTGRASSCDDGRHRSEGILARLLHHYSSTSMEFVVAVPPGVRVDASTVNGRVTIADAAGEVQARSVNGPVTVGAVGGPVRAATVNGAVDVHADSLVPNAEVIATSVNGSVAAALPPSIGAALDMSTTNGRVSTDFPLAVTDRHMRRLHTVLGAGGRTVKLHTVNGSVTLQKLQ